jgi:lipid A ethanolaminephosphotransferase
MVGETARADHFSLNGYRRDTNPELARRDVVSFSDASSCGTSTAESLPCMFSHLGRVAYQASEVDHENLLDALQRAGLAVLWIDNQSGCKGVCDRVPHAMAADAAPGSTAAPSSVCNGSECLDEALLLGLDQRLAALDPARRARGVVLVMHQMGSHGPAYSTRSPAEHKPFKPECTTTALQQCAHDELINAYDNSIAYTDHVLALGIDWLQRQTAVYDPAMLYVSDHGESLGENHLYLHGLPYSIAPVEQKHVPLIIWLAGQTQAASGVTTACLRGRAAEPLSHDNLFHTVAGFMGVSTAVYRPGLDLLAACRAP